MRERERAHSPTTSISECLETVWKVGLSADTSQVYLPEDWRLTWRSITFIESLNAVCNNNNNTCHIIPLMSTLLLLKSCYYETLDTNECFNTQNQQVSILGSSVERQVDYSFATGDGLNVWELAVKQHSAASCNTCVFPQTPTSTPMEVIDPYIVAL